VTTASSKSQDSSKKQQQAAMGVHKVQVQETRRLPAPSSQLPGTHLLIDSTSVLVLNDVEHKKQQAATASTFLFCFFVFYLLFLNPKSLSYIIATKNYNL
jgi:hypothetical protein